MLRLTYRRYWMLLRSQATTAAPWQCSPTRPQTRCRRHNFEGETSPQLENQVLCMDLAPRKQVAQDAVGFWEDSGSQSPFLRPRRERWVSGAGKLAGMGNRSQLLWCKVLPSSHHRPLCSPHLQRLPASLLPRRGQHPTNIWRDAIAVQSTTPGSSWPANATSSYRRKVGIMREG